jgi:hypothetical protein
LRRAHHSFKKSYRLCKKDYETEEEAKKDYETEEEARAQQRAVEPLIDE